MTAGSEPRVSSATTRLAAAAAVAAALTLGVFASWPIYETTWLVAVAGGAFVLGVGLALFAVRWRWAPLPVLASLGIAYVLTVIPVALPQRAAHIAEDPLGTIAGGIVEGVAALVLGWKQLLSLTLPVGMYQTTLVPAYVVFLASAFLATAAALRGGRAAAWAAAPLLAPVAFGTIFGAAQASASVVVGPIAIAAPRETALWAAGAVLATCWVAWASGAARRAALRRGRTGSRGPRAGRGARWIMVGAVIAIAAAGALAAAPMLATASGGERGALRDRVDPEIVVRERPSPLAAYRVFKRDDAFDATLFTVASPGDLPPRLRLAVLDRYDGVDFHVGSEEAARFTRLPSGDRLQDPTRVTIEVGAGYADIWAPTAGFGSVPEFRGPRAGALADGFFVNRRTESAIAAPAGVSGSSPGLREGDGYVLEMRAAPDEPLERGPSGQRAASGAGVDLSAMPELSEWLRVQGQPSTAAGLIELIDRLRSRGYLSHSLSEREGEQRWLAQLEAEFGAEFAPSPGGHSIARLEELFAQLNARERSAGPEAETRELVAGIGDDEQFAAAAALIARALGFESRVVLGVRLADASAGGSANVAAAARAPGVPDCTGTCTGANLAAWIEVRGDGGPWAPIDVTPQVVDPPGTSTEGQRLPEYPSTPEQRDAREVDPPVGVGEPTDDAAPPVPQRSDAEASTLLPIIGFSLLGLLSLALPIGFLPVAKHLRTRRRRREAEPELRALGAWYELTGSAADLGEARLVAPGSPTAESRRAQAERLAEDGFPMAPWIARQVDAAVFSATPLTSAEAQRIWEAVDADLAQRAAQLSFWQRLRARYSLRSYGMRFAERRRSREESAGAPATGARIRERD